MKPDGFSVGGTVAYAGLLAARLGLDVAIVTSCGDDIGIERTLAPVSASVRFGPESTTFENVYDDSHRRQRILGLAEPLSLSDVPPEWRSSPIVLLGPVAGELQPDLFTAFNNSLLGLTPQGMMRAWDSEGAVRAVRWEQAEALLGGVNALVLSEDDLPDSGELTRYTALVEIVAVTHSERGATVYDNGTPTHFPAYPSNPVEFTGAGDVFAAAFLIELHTSGNLERAAKFANCAASFVIEAEGAAALPARSQIEERLRSSARATP